MRSALHTLGLLLVAVSLVGAGPGRCVMADGHEAPAEHPSVPPCHEAPPRPDPPDGHPCPAGVDGAAACCAAPAATTAAASAPSHAPTGALVPATVVVPVRATAPVPRPAARPPDRPPGAGLALFGCFRI